MNEPAVPDALLPPSADAIIEAPSGPILVIRRCSPDLIERLTVDSGFGHILRPRTAKTTLRRIAARLSGNVTLAVAPGGVIVGYVLVARPEPTRWQQRVMHER
ncbi:MAG: hypothetical protein NTZ05_17570 [Chloroflexi bacterium]|nr:hypothetical protein [Chloroflexota bacterium]